MQHIAQCTRCGYATARPWSRCWCCARPLYRCTRGRRHLFRPLWATLRFPRSSKDAQEDLAELIAAW